jgi:HK97 family phage major capsid protein
MTIIDFPELRETEGRIDALQAKLKTVLEEAGPEKDFSKVKALGDGDTATKIAELAKINDELGDLGKKHREQTIVLKAAEFADDYHGFEHGDRLPGKGRRETLGEQFVKSAARTQKETAQTFDVDVKALMSRTAGWAPESLREPGYVPFASAPIMVADIIPTLTTGQAAVRYMEQTVRTNAAAERAENAAYGEATIELAERSVTVESIGVWIPVTDEQLEDVDEAQSLIDFDLPLMLRQRLDLQQLVGNGTTPNIRGVNNVVGIQTQALGADPVMDAIFKARTRVRVTGRAMPNAVVLHPNDWQDIRLTRTADGIYILGNPDAAGPTQLWGMTVVESDNQTQNTGIVGDFLNWSRFYVRRGIEIERTNSHASDFINGRQAVRASMRGAMVWKRPAAFCTVTGI